MKTKADASENLGKTLQDGLLKSWDQYLFWREKFLNGGSRKSVHQLRTIIRKLSSQLDIIPESLASKSAKRLRKLVKRELKSLGALRDVQVQLKKLSVLTSSSLKSAKYHRYLLRKEKACLRQARKSFRRWGDGRQRESLLKLERKLTRKFLKASDKKRSKMLSQLRKRFQRGMASAGQLQLELQPGNHKSFHKLRIQVKDLAYKSEAVATLLDLKPRFISDIEFLKKELGQLQDKVVFLDSAQSFLKKDKNHSEPENELKKDIEIKEQALVQYRVRLQ